MESAAKETNDVEVNDQQISSSPEMVEGCVFAFLGFIYW